jgi:hypothetical protein
MFGEAMPTREILIVIDESNHFNKIFLPFARELQAKIIAFDLKCEIVWGDLETTARKVIFGAHSSPEYWLKHTHNEDIIVNLEPFYKPAWRKNNPNYLKLVQTRCVFEYCSLNLPYLEDGHLFKIPPMYSDLKPTKTKEFDVVFIGSRNKYRNNFLKEIEASGLKLGIAFDVLDKDAFHAFDRSWLYLNLDLDEESAFNDFRFMSCAMSSTLFVGHSGDITNHPEMQKLVGLSIFDRSMDLVKGLQDLISNKSKIMQAFMVQYTIAQENNKQFDRFIKQHFTLR